MSVTDAVVDGGGREVVLAVRSPKSSPTMS